MNQQTLEEVTCPLCENTGGTVVGQQVRFGIAAVNLCCSTCATVYTSPRRSVEAIREGYAAERRGASQRVSLPTPDGLVAPGEPGYERALDARAEAQALNAARLARVQTGDRVIEVGCGDGAVLAIQRDLLGIEPEGIEFDPQLGGAARARGVDCRSCSIDALDFGTEQYDLIQIFHRLQHAPDPLSWLMTARSALSSGGRLAIEVPNLHRPYGLLEENFFQLQNLTTFSPSTLVALCHRAGLKIEQIISGSSLFVVARSSRTAPLVPKPFSPDLLLSPEQNMEWTARRLATYAVTQRIRTTIMEQGPTMDLMHGLVHQFAQPAFVDHQVDTVIELVQFFIGHEALGLACLVATAASESNCDPVVARGFAQLAASIRQSSSPSGVSTKLQSETEYAIAHEPGPVQQVLEALRRDFSIDVGLKNWTYGAIAGSMLRPQA